MPAKGAPTSRALGEVWHRWGWFGNGAEDPTRQPRSSRLHFLLSAKCARPTTTVLWVKSPVTLS
jgi:hypothetical protein